MNNEQSLEHLSNALVYQDSVPLVAEALTDGLVQSSHQQHEIQNLNILQLLWSMQESQTELPEHYHDLAPAFLRLDTKLDIVLNMLGQVMSQSMQLPPVTPFRLTSTSFSWLTGTRVDLGARWQVQCYILASIPIPLTLSGKVRALHPHEQQHWVNLELEPLGEPLADLLDKIIFRAHRRAVAKLRHNPNLQR